MKFNVENCDVTMENGSLRLVYHTDKMLLPMVLVISNSYHDLNEKAMYFFGQDEWAKNVIEWRIRKESPIWDNLLADIYKNHHDVYDNIMNDTDKDEDTEDEVIGYLTLTATGDTDKDTGHRIAHFKKADLEALDGGILHAFADAFGIEDCEYMFREELIDALSKEDIDMDDCDYDCDDCDCAEKTPEGNVICHQDEDTCDCDCKNCDDYDDDVDEHPEWPHPIEGDTKGYEYVDGPAHYHGTECIENMRKLYGDEAVRWFCILSAYKYRFRDGSKPGVSAEQDQEKADWYEDYVVKMRSEQNYY